MRLEQVIQSIQNAWVKRTAQLHRSAARREQSKFLLEGPHLIQEAISSQWPLETIAFDEEWANAHSAWLQEWCSQAEALKALLQPVSSQVMRKLSTTDTPCSVIAVALDQPSNHFQNRSVSLALALESIQDPGNLGTLIRTSAAVGIDPVIVSRDSVCPTNPKVLRSTAGQWFRAVPQTVELESFVRAQRDLGVQVLAAAADGTNYWDLDFRKPTLFLLGNEGAGLSNSLRSLATVAVRVPMATGVESLNVAMTGTLLLYEALRQRCQIAGSRPST